MRFLASGPAIPDELLVARDEGRVVFFCGAGVSRARAELPDFFGLAAEVSDVLGVTADSPARRIIDEASQLDARIGVSGLIPADRVFGLLEREFRTKDIESAVAKALIPSEDVDLSAHRILIDLARAPTGEVQLVTTNFDLLFEACDDSLHQWQPPRLPDPARRGEIDGIIHLHGRVDELSNGAFGDGFVLSSSEFGNAYLADGWATQFIRAVLDRFLVVFVGYTADDPPVQYLLEALNRQSDLGRAYAFQSGDESDARAKWRHKGVKAISYDSANKHEALWETLSTWAERAKDSDLWYENTIELARKGPAAVAPHERGQVAHVVSTLAGARKFSSTSVPPPAEWLCVFDPFVRYAPPRRSFDSSEHGKLIDPFNSYGLDSDPTPQQADPADLIPKRAIPENLWNGLSLTRLDKVNLRDSNYAAVRGPWAANVPSLSPRLLQIGLWISNVAHQPGSVWWAAGQFGLHPDIQNQILLQLERRKKDSPREVRRAWRYLFEAWETRRENHHRDWYGIKASIALDGWTRPTIRRLESIFRPYLKVERPQSASLHLAESDGATLARMIRLDVEYPNQYEDPQIPDEWLQSAAQAFRKNLEHSVRLENEIGDYGLHSISPIEEDPDVEGDVYQRTHGISKCLLFYVVLFQRLVNFDLDAARREQQSWPDTDEYLFVRLRIWAAGDSRLRSPAEVARLLNSLPDAVFWGSNHARDLLLVLAKRWCDLSNVARKRIERRLLRGRQRRDQEGKDDFEKRRAFAVLNRIHWLADQGCHFSFDLDSHARSLRAIAADWKPEYASKAAASMEGGGGSVRIDTSHANLLAGPLDTVLARAQEQGGRRQGLLVENDPFAGLSAHRPVRAFRVLTSSSKRNIFPEWAWRTFLNNEARNVDKAKFSALISYRLSEMPRGILAELLRPTADWLLRVSDSLLLEFPEAFDAVWSRLILVLSTTPGDAKSAVGHGREGHDWAEEALNAPVGYLAQAVLKDPCTNGLVAGTGFPRKWTTRFEELLALDGDLRRHALVFIGFQLNWIFTIDPNWTVKSIIPLLDRAGDDQDAIWAGYFWCATVPSFELYSKLKPRLLIFARSERTVRRGNEQVIAGFCLAGWGTINKESGERWISDNEMRSLLIDASENIRCQVLWQLGNWASKSTDGEDDGWYGLLPVFLGTVWPRQRKVNSTRVSKRLFNLAFSAADRFPEISEIILPLVSKIDSDNFVLPHLGNSESGIVDLHPAHALALLHAALSDNVKSWPYGVDELLLRISKSDPELRADERFVELANKWEKR